MSEPAAARMRWSSASSTARVLRDAVAEASATIRQQLGETRPDLAIVFVSAHHESAYDAVPAVVADALAPAALLGCSAGAVIGGGQELEGEPGVSITAAVLPNATVRCFHVPAEALADGAAPDFAAVLGATTEDDGDPPRAIVLADPFSTDVERVTDELSRGVPRGRIVGGLASGGATPGANVLYAGADVHRTGIVGAALAGDVALDTIVAQGCRPIGDPMFVTSAQRNMLYALDGRGAVSMLQELYRTLDKHDQALCRDSLFLGIAMRPHGEEYRHGDFLVRSILAMDAAAGALGVGAALREGMVVQFHVRDARTSADDLEAALSAYEREHRSPPAGAVLFSCLGRGVGLYGRANHDSDEFRRRLGDVPLGGFFCNGEIGPVQGTTFVHGYTSAFGLFRPRA